MPGAVSDSFDPEFGTAAAAAEVAAAVALVRDKITAGIGSADLQNIVKLARAYDRSGGSTKEVRLSETELRIIRFAMNRALESL